MLFASCVPKEYACNYTEKIYVENNTDREIIYEITFNPTWSLRFSTNDDSLLYYNGDTNIWDSPYYDIEAPYVIRTFGIVAVAQNGMQFFISINGDQKNWGEYDKCNSWNHFDASYRQHIIYNMNDTCSYEIDDIPYNCNLFTRPYPQENGVLTQVNSFCLVITDSILDLMQKDTSMLTKFADYYSQE